MEKLGEKRENTTPAIIRHRPTQTAQLEIPYESSGLIETDDKLYDEIFSLARKKSSILLKAITRTNINKAIEIIKARESLRSLNVHIGSKGNINLQLFIKDIITKGQEAEARVSLEFPGAGKTEHLTWILEEILKLIPEEQQKEFHTEYGEIYFTVNFSEKIFPEEVGKNSSNQRKFVAVEKI